MIGFIGGTGPEGRGLALRFALAGEKVFIGSRNKSRGIEIAEEIEKHSPGFVIGGSNEEASAKSDIIVIATPYDAQRTTVQELKSHLNGKIIVNVIAPLSFNKGSISSIRVEDGSAALECQKLLPDSSVISAFNNISAQDLLKKDKKIDCDVIVCGNEDNSKKTVMDLAEKIYSIRAIDGGTLENSRYVEDLTALLLNINKIYKWHSSIKIVS
ncbi:MAG: NADPH-dependent F420 reductase [Dehalococcoidia bacterium]